MAGEETYYNSNNEFLLRFNAAAAENGLVDDLTKLYHFETMHGQNHVADSIMSLLVSLPVFNQFETLVDKTSRIREKTEKAQIEHFRATVSKKFVATINNVTPGDGASWEEYKQFNEFLYLIHGEMLAKSAREEFLNIRNLARTQWQTKVASNNAEQNNQIIAAFDAEAKQQQQYRNNISEQMQTVTDTQRQTLTKLSSMSQQQSANTATFSERMQEIREQLQQQGIAIDENTLLLLQSDTRLAEQLHAVSQYLAMQESRAQAQQTQQRIQANYQGAIDGFNLLAAVGQQFNNHNLYVLGSIGTQAVVIHKSISDAVTLASSGTLAALSPYVAIGMALLKISGLFIKRGQTAEKFIHEQLRQVSQQVESLHRDMHQQFANVHKHLYHIERLLVQGINSLLHVTNVSVVKRLIDIKSDVQRVSEQIHSGFKSSLLVDLSKTIGRVDYFLRGITTTAEKKHVENWLVELSLWLTEYVYDQQLTGAYIFGGTEIKTGVLNCSYASLVKALSSTSMDSVVAINIILAVARADGWYSASSNDYDNEQNVAPVLAEDRSNATQVFVPYTDVWLHVMHYYLLLRKDNSERYSASKCYDEKHNDAEKIYQRMLQSIINIQTLTTDVDLIRKVHHRISEIYAALQMQYQQLSSLNGKKSILQASSDSNTRSESNSIPNAWKLIYDPSYYKGQNANAHAAELTSGNEFTQKQCISLLAASFKNNNIELFTKNLLLAEKFGLVEFRFIIHRNLRLNKRVIHVTKSGLFGVETIVEFKQDNTHFNLTSATKFQAPQTAQCVKNSLPIIIETYQNCLAKASMPNQQGITKADQKASTLLKELQQQAEQSMQSMLAANLLGDNTLAQQLMMYLWVGKCLSIISNYHLATDDYDAQISELSLMLKSIETHTNNKYSNVESFYANIDKRRQQFLGAESEVASKTNWCKPLGDLLHGRQQMLNVFGNSLNFFPARQLITWPEADNHTSSQSPVNTMKPS